MNESYLMGVSSRSGNFMLNIIWIKELVFVAISRDRNCQK
jgi:hypothetical protein